MLLIKKIVSLFICFTLINAVLIHDGEPFDNVLSLLVPFNEGSEELIAINFLLGTFINIVILSMVNKVIDEQFEIFTFILSRSTMCKVALSLWSDILKNILQIMVVKAIVSLLFSRMNGMQNVDVFVIAMVSMLLTCLIWAEIFFLLKLYRVPSKIIYLSLVFLSITNALLSNYAILTLFINGSNYLFMYPIFWLSAKFLLFCMLFFIKYRRFKSFEHLGVEKND